MLKVSIGCTVYNHEKYLRGALDGFIKQKTSFDYEVIVHDDASTDSSAEIIREYASKYPNIIKPIYQKENQYSKGILITNTFVIPAMQGEYLAHCEGDDYWTDENKLQKQVDFLDAHQEYCACMHNVMKRDMWHGTCAEMYHWGADRDLTFADTVQGICHISALLYRSNVRKHLPAYMQKQWGFGDYPLFMYLSTLGKIRYINKPMSVYRYGVEGSYTVRTSSSAEKTLKIYENCNRLLAEINLETKEKYSDLIQAQMLKNRYSMAEIRGDYRALRKMPLKTIYETMPLKYKLKKYLLQISGPVGKAYQECVRKNSEENKRCSSK